MIGFPLPWGELQRASPPIIQACITKKKTHSIPSELLGTNIEDQKSRRMKIKIHRSKIRVQTGEAKNKSRDKGAAMKEQPNPVLGLRIPERALNPFSLQLKSEKQGMNKENK